MIFLPHSLVPQFATLPHTAFPWVTSVLVRLPDCPRLFFTCSQTPLGWIPHRSSRSWILLVVYDSLDSLDLVLTHSLVLPMIPTFFCGSSLFYPCMVPILDHTTHVVHFPLSSFWVGHAPTHLYILEVMDQFSSSRFTYTPFLHTTLVLFISGFPTTWFLDTRFFLLYIPTFPTVWTAPWFLPPF